MKNLFSLFCFLFLALLTACQTDDGTGPAITVEPGTAIVVNDYEGWDEIRTSADGSTFFNKYAADGSTIESTYFVLKADTAAPLIGYARFDENQMPRYIYFDGVSIFVDRYDGSLLDASVVVNDSIVLRADSLQLTFDPTRPDTRSFAQNNWVRNLCDVGNLVCGVLSVGAGGALVLAKAPPPASVRRSPSAPSWPESPPSSVVCRASAVPSTTSSSRSTATTRSGSPPKTMPNPAAVPSSPK